MKIKAVIIIVYAITIVLFPLSLLASKDTEHPPIVLLDHDGNDISIDSKLPYSPKNTCGECHDYDTITNAYHFQQGRTDAEGNIIIQDGLDSKNPWLISKGMYGKW